MALHQNDWDEGIRMERFSRDHKELVDKLFRCFPPGQVRYYCNVLVRYPLKAAKMRLILKPHTRGHEILGMLTDHVLGVARKVGIPQVYISRVSELRGSVRRLQTVEGESEYLRKRRVTLHLRTFDLIDAIVEVSPRQ